MNVKWATLEAVAATKAIDVGTYSHFPDFYSQATRRMSTSTTSSEEAITRQLGTDAWERELYSDPGQADIFWRAGKTTNRGCRRAWRIREGAVGNDLSKGARIRWHCPSTRSPSGSPSSSAFRIPEPKAIGLATRIAESHPQDGQFIIGRAAIDDRGFLVLAAPLLEEERGSLRRHMASISSTHSPCIGRAFGPLSPPTIAQ